MKSKYKFTEELQDSYFSGYSPKITSFLSRFWANNKYLREVNNLGVPTFVKRLNYGGFKTSENSIYFYEQGKDCTFSLFYLLHISEYWGIPLQIMLNDDISNSSKFSRVQGKQF